MSESPEMRKPFADWFIPYQCDWSKSENEVPDSLVAWNAWQAASAPVDLEMCLNAADKDIYYQRIKEAIKAVTDELIRQSVRMTIKQKE